MLKKISHSLLYRLLRLPRSEEETSDTAVIKYLKVKFPKIWESELGNKAGVTLSCSSCDLQRDRASWPSKAKLDLALPKPGSVCARSAFSESNVGRPLQKLPIWTPKHYKVHRKVVTEVFLHSSLEFIGRLPKSGWSPASTSSPKQGSALF